MSDHPEFPQATPEMKYVVEQVSKIEDAQACGTGYYKTLKDVLARIGKLDVSLNQLTQTNSDLKKVVDSTTVAAIIGKKSDDINNTLRLKLDLINKSNALALSGSIARIERNNSEMNMGFIRLMEEISETNKKLKSQIQLQHDCVIIRPWKAWSIVFISAVAGFAFGVFYV